MSLINHGRGYSVTNIEIAASFMLLGTGIVYCNRHLQMLKRPNASNWHLALALIEMVPILGAVVALVEYALFRLGCFHRAEEQAPVSFPPTVNTLTLDPSLKAKYYIDLLKSKESEVNPFGQKRRCVWEPSTESDDTFFEELQHVHTGEEFIEGLRRFDRMKKPRELAAAVFNDIVNGIVSDYEPIVFQLTWADLTFYHRPALYWAIYWQNLPFIESILTSPEGKRLLHHSYPIDTADYRTDPAAPPVVPREGLERLAEYPIHQAVRQSTLRHQSFPTKEAAEEASRNAMQIVLRLLELNANVNQADGVGRTPLHIALKIENIQMMKLLIKEGGTVRLSPIPGQMLETLEEDKLQKLAQVCHDLDEEIGQEIVTSTLLLPDLSKLIVRYLY